MKNFVQAGLIMTVAAATAAVTAGQPVVQGTLLGVASTDAGVGESFPLALQGVFELPKTTGAAWTQGQPLMWDASAKTFAAVGTAASGDVIGVACAWEAAASGSNVGLVRLSGGQGTVTA